MNLFNLDWREYFEEFKRIHGEPVPYRGRLLFPDGYTYSASDPKGPEWPPPHDPHDLILHQLAYWTIRLNVVESELRKLLQLYDNLTDMQLSRSATLQHRYRGEDGKMAKGPVDPTLLLGRIRWLRQDVEECNAKIEELTLKNKEVSNGTTKTRNNVKSPNRRTPTKRRKSRVAD